MAIATEYPMSPAVPACKTAISNMYRVWGIGRPLSAKRESSTAKKPIPTKKEFNSRSFSAEILSICLEMITNFKISSMIAATMMDEGEMKKSEREREACDFSKKEKATKAASSKIRAPKAAMIPQKKDSILYFIYKCAK